MSAPVQASMEAVRKDLIGTVHLSAWRTVGQRAINEFASSTEDPDPMHVDPDWTRSHTPYPNTVAQGFWAASMLVKAAHETGLARTATSLFPAAYGLNYGFDRLRFVRPLLVGASYRCRLVPTSYEMRSDTSAMLEVDARVEVRDQRVPALTGNWLLLFVLDEEAGN
ncbi:MaoC family dehydratase [Hyphomonas sp.]|uniref:MaoC family dehydratase n=1 Tax=Hyphomonas sp. TaxID=87 RepID=UPI00391BB750